MTTALIYKTETTGLIDWQAPSEAPHQPNIVHLSANLVDLDLQKTIARMAVIVRPTKWKIPEEASAVHGIDTGYALAVGVPESLAVEMLYELWCNASVRVAYSEPFDARIIRIALMRYHKKLGIDPDRWKDGNAESVQQMASPIVKAPPTAKMIAAGRTGHKSATLAEAYQHFYGAQLDGIGISDLDACQAVYFAVKGIKANAEA